MTTSGWPASTLTLLGMCLIVALMASDVASFTALDPYQSGGTSTRRNALLPPVALRLSSEKSPAGSEPTSAVGGGSEREQDSKRTKMRDRIKFLARNMVTRPISTAASVAPTPRKIAKVLTDATAGAVDDVIVPALDGQQQRSIHRFRAFANIEDTVSMEAEATAALDSIALAKTTAADAFDAAERAITDAQTALVEASRALSAAKLEAREGIASAESSAVEALASAQRATALASSAAAMSTEVGEERSKGLDPDSSEVGDRIAEEDAVSLSYEDVEYHLSEMAPPFIGEDQCLVPGEAVVRVEKAPENSRRIFAGIDIMASVDDVWKVLTDYENLQRVVPNLVVNEVVDLYEGDDEFPSNAIDPSLPDEMQCEKLSKHMKGSKLRQVGGAKVVGINFSARTLLEVREWPEGMPDFAHFFDEEVYEGKDRASRAREGKRMKLQRYRFPRPFALTKLKHRDISMQSVEDDDGEFRLYQGVWRMQPLPGCAPEGGNAMRLTYAVEISPRPYLPVALVEGRITQDLCTNLIAIREFVSS